MPLSASDRLATGTATKYGRAGRTLLWIVLSAYPVFAGPPFHTDDPEPVAYHHWEAYLFATADRAKGGRTYQVPAWELNAGVAPNLQLHLVVPLAYFRAPGERGNTREGLPNATEDWEQLRHSTPRREPGMCDRPSRGPLWRTDKLPNDGTQPVRDHPCGTEGRQRQGTPIGQSRARSGQLSRILWQFQWRVCRLQK